MSPTKSEGPTHDGAPAFGSIPAASVAAGTATAPALGVAAARRTELSPERMAKFHEYAEEYPNKRSALMMTLRLAEEEFGSITDEAMEIAAGLCNVPVAHVQGMVTFYTHFKRPFHGTHRFMVCATLMCALDGNTGAALAQIKAKLGIKAGEKTADGLFSCEKVECLAECDKPPVVQKDNEHFCSMRGKLLDDYIDALLKREGKSVSEYAGKAGVAMDTRVPYLPSHFNFPGETAAGARHFEDKDPYLAPGQGGRTTAIPKPLATPLTVPVADGVDADAKIASGGKRPQGQPSANGHQKGGH